MSVRNQQVSSSMTGESEGSGLATYLVRPGRNVIVRTPSWNGTETVFRPFPAVSREDRNQFYPYRMDPTGANYFGNWIRWYDVAWKVGTPSTTFIVHNPEAGSHMSFDPSRSPLGILNSAIRNAAGKGQGRPEWFPLLNSSEGRLGGTLSRPQKAAFMQGMLLRYGDKDMFGGGRPAPGTGDAPGCILAMTSALASKLKGQCDLTVPGALQHSATDFESRYVHGDVVGVNHGRYIHIFQAGNDPRQKYAAAPTTAGQPQASSWSSMSGPPSPGGQQQERKTGYDLFLAKDFRGRPASLLSPEDQECIRSKWVQWEDLWLFPSLEEQAFILCDIFPASAILYAFQDRPEWISESVKRRAVNPTSVSMPPGMGWPGAAPAVPPNWNPAMPQQMPQQGYGVPMSPPQQGYGIPAVPPQHGYGVPAMPPQQGYGVPFPPAQQPYQPLPEYPPQQPLPTPTYQPLPTPTYQQPYATPPESYPQFVPPAAPAYAPPPAQQQPAPSPFAGLPAPFPPAQPQPQQPPAPQQPTPAMPQRAQVDAAVPPGSLPPVDYGSAFTPPPAQQPANTPPSRAADSLARLQQSRNQSRTS